MENVLAIIQLLALLVFFEFGNESLSGKIPLA